MRGNKWIIPMMVLATMMVWVTTTQGAESDSMDKRAVYSKMIDRYAACCEKKSMLRHSRSENLRQKAEISCLKAAYLRNYKDEIVADLIEHNINPQPYKVQHFVNTLFFDLIRRESATLQNHAIPAGYIATEQIGIE